MDNVPIYNFLMPAYKFWLTILLILALPLQGLALAGSCAKHHNPQPTAHQVHTNDSHDCEAHHTASAQHNTQNIDLTSADGNCSACAFCHASHSILAATATIGSVAASATHITYVPANYLSPAAAVLDPPPKSLTL